MNFKFNRKKKKNASTKPCRKLCAPRHEPKSNRDYYLRIKLRIQRLKQLTASKENNLNKQNADKS